jgi:Na+-transporting NADH:ubiquinone oxidoreductase subunit A
VRFEGPHPAGLVGTHIHHLCPVSAARRVWHIGYQDVIAIGALLGTGRNDPERVVALGGPHVLRPRLLRTRLGASTEDLVRGELLPGESRIVSGSALSGRRALHPAAFLGRYHEQVCALPVLPAGSTRRRGWLVPRPGGARRVPPWRRPTSWTAEMHGPRRAMLPLDLFDRVVPLHLPIGLLLRALAAGDVESAERYGALELEEEDLALCSYVCPSKLEYGSLLRRVLGEIEAGQA